MALRANSHLVAVKSRKSYAVMRGMSGDAESTTPPQMLEQHEKRLTERLEAVRTVRTALTRFYAGLKDEQATRIRPKCETYQGLFRNGRGCSRGRSSCAAGVTSCGEDEPAAISAFRHLRVIAGRLWELRRSIFDHLLGAPACIDPAESAAEPTTRQLRREIVVNKHTKTRLPGRRLNFETLPHATSTDRGDRANSVTRTSLRLARRRSGRHQGMLLQVADRFTF